MHQSSGFDRRAPRRAAAIVIVMLVTGGLPGCRDSAPPERSEPNEVVATVNGTAITRGEVEGLIEGAVSRNPSRGVTDKIRRGALESLLGSELMYRAAIARGMTVEPERLAEKLAGVRSQFPNDEAFAAYLARAGLTAEQLDERSERRLLVDAYARDVVGDTTPSDAELRAAYEARRSSFMALEAVRARQVMVRLRRKGDPEENHRLAREAAEQARRRLLDGESWDTVARELSNGPNALKGGEMGWVERGHWIKEFDELVFATPVGEMTEVFRTRFGYHLVEVLERREPAPQPFEAVRNSLSLTLTRERRDSALDAHLRSLLEQAELEIHDDDLRRAMEGDAD